MHLDKQYFAIICKLCDGVVISEIIYLIKPHYFIR